MIDYTTKISLALNVVGLINIQFAENDGTVYVLEANPRKITASLLTRAQ